MPEHDDRTEPVLEPPGAASLPEDVPMAPAEAEAAAGAAAGMDAGAVAAAPRRSAAALVAAGIFLSRVMGLVRERAVSFFFGLGPPAGAPRVALKPPNSLQTPRGEGTISAAFIPISGRFLAGGRPGAAGRFAGAVF